MDQVTVYVLLRFERGIRSTRFFVARNGDLAAQFRQPPTSNPIAFIDAKSVEKYRQLGCLKIGAGLSSK